MIPEFGAMPVYGKPSSTDDTDEFGGVAVKEPKEDRDEFGGLLVSGTAPQPTQPEAPQPTQSLPASLAGKAWDAYRKFSYDYPNPATTPFAVGASMVTGQKPPTERGVVSRLQKGFESVPKSQANLALSFTENDDTLKQFLLKAQEEQNKQPRDLSIPEQAAELVGGLGGVLTEGLVASKGGKIGIGAMFGSMEGGNAFLDAGIRALNEGQSPENALLIAKNQRNLMMVTGAASARLFPGKMATRWMPALGKAFPKTLGQSAFGQGSQVSSVLGGLKLTKNVGEKVQGLETPLMEGVLPAMGLGFLVGKTPYAASRLVPAFRGVKAKLESPRKGELPPIKDPALQQQIESNAVELGKSRGQNIQIRDKRLDETPFNEGQLAVPGPNGEVVVNRKLLHKWLERKPEGVSNEEFLKALFNHEGIHTYTTDEAALSFFKNSTKTERTLSTKFYSSKWRNRGKLTPTQRGHEMMRTRIEKILGMTSQEIIQAKGADKLGLKAISVLEDVVFGLRKKLGTDASTAQLELLNKLEGKLRVAKFVAGGGEETKAEPTPLTPEEQQVEIQRSAKERNFLEDDTPVEPAKPVSEPAPSAIVKGRENEVAIPEKASDALELAKRSTVSPDAWKKTGGGTEFARDIGSRFKTPEEVAQLKQFAEELKAKSDTSKDKIFGSMMRQYANEMLEGATKAPEKPMVAEYFKEPAKPEPKGREIYDEINQIKAKLKKQHPYSEDSLINNLAMDEMAAKQKAAQEPRPSAITKDSAEFKETRRKTREKYPLLSEAIIDEIAMEEAGIAKGSPAAPSPKDYTKPEGRWTEEKAPSAIVKEAEKLAKDENLIFKVPKEPWPGAEWEFTYNGEGKARGATFQMPEGATKAEIKARLEVVKNDFETKPQAGPVTEAEKAELIAAGERQRQKASEPTQPSELPKTPVTPDTAKVVGEPPKPPVQPPPTPPEGAPESLPSAITKEPKSDANFRLRDIIPATFRYFSEGMVERIGRSGGEQAKIAEPLLNRVISEQKGHYGSLTDILDPALEAAGKMNKATKWINDFDKITDGAAIARGPEALEGKIKVPDFVKPLIETARKANLRIGQMYEAVTEGFEATGAWQRNLTGFGYDLIRRGRGRVWERLAEGIAKANKKPIEDVKAMLGKMKETYDEPSPSVNSIEKVNQDFAREFPRAVTHVKVNTYLGAKWEPVLHSQLYSYLESAARRASHVRSFRGVFKTPEDIAKMSKDVRAELDPSHQQDFDALIRGLQGHPSDNYGGLTILSPDQPPAATLKLFNQTVGNLMAKFVLSGQMMTQAGETLAGATPIFLGASRYLKAMARVKQLYTEMERTGSVNKVIYDMSTDPTRPILSKFRQAGNIISKGTAQQFLNELQEGLAAATARLVKEDILAGRLSNWDKAMLPLTFEKMGFSRAQAADMIQGKQPHLLTEFERKAAAWMTSGNKAIAEGSRLGASRLFNSVFRFQQYAMARSNQLRKVWGGVGKASQEYYKNPSKENGMRLWRESRQFARFHTGATLQGALTSAVFALFYGGPSGLKILYNEAKDDKAKFLMESFLAATSGPLYLVMRGREYGGITGIGEQVVRSMFPYQIMRSFIDMAQGAGQFRDMLPKDRVGKFVQQKIPASRALSTGLSLVGLSWENQPLDNSIKGFYRWRRDEMGKSTFKDETEAYKKRAYFRTHMRKAVNALKVGDIEGVKAEVAKAAQSPDLKPNSVVSSLNARKILKNPNLRDLGPDEIEKLRKRIGPEAVERLQRFDAMIDALIEMYQ